MTTKYLVDTLNLTGLPQVMDETVSGAVTRTYAYGLSRISEDQLIGSTWTPSFYGYDGHGNVRFLTNSAGTVTDSYTYDAFGMPIASTGTTPNNFLYSGEQYDGPLGLYYLRARYLNPATGRFLGMDPLHDKSSCRSTSPSQRNAYAYVSDDPVNRIDPTGRAEAIAEYAIDLRGVLLTAWVGIQTYQAALSKHDCVLQWVQDNGVGDCVDCVYKCKGWPGSLVVFSQLRGKACPSVDPNTGLVNTNEIDPKCGGPEPLQ